MRFLKYAALVSALMAMITAPAAAQERTFVLLADERLAQSGLLDFLVPRFALKHQIRPTVEIAGRGAVGLDAAGADIILVARDQAGAGAAAAFHSTGGDSEVAYAVRLSDGAANARHAEAFLDWLTGDIGRATIETFKVDDVQVFMPGPLGTVVVPEVVINGDANMGERLALIHCGRCHVVSDRNRMGGIGSTPSFAALRAIPGWQDKFLAFWTANPHPSFTQVEGLTEPFDPNRPPHIAPVEITQTDIDAILAYAASVEPKDLGSPVSSR